MDSGPFVGVYNSADQHFDLAVSKYSKLASQNWTLLTTDYVIDETYTRLITKAGYEPAMGFDRFLKLSNLKVERIDLKRFAAAQEVFRRFNKDKKWSFTDCTSYVVMKELKIKTVFAFDKNFEEMGFKLI